jgi:hypothetical protein
MTILPHEIELLECNEKQSLTPATKPCRQQTTATRKSKEKKPARINFSTRKEEQLLCTSTDAEDCDARRTLQEV